MQSMLNLAARGALALLLLFAVGMAGLSLWLRLSDSSLLAASGSSPATTLSRADDDVAFAERLSRTYRAAARRILPAAVVIKAESNDGCEGGQCPNHGQSAGRGLRSNRTQAKQRVAAQEKKAELVTVGSGFLVASSGVVLTNHHVIEDTRGLAVKLADGRVLPVVAIESDKGLDLAALKVNADEPLPAAVLGDPEALEVGDMVLTIGSPMEMDQTVSAGILSAKGRTFCPEHDAKLLQTDAAIGPGSSGGAMVNLRGEVVGVATAMLSDTDSYSGIGFAVPIGCAKDILERLEKKTQTR